MAFIKYFFYLAFNWNIRIAIFVIYHELRGEKKYRQHTIGIDDLKDEIPAENRLHASIYQPINYYIAELLFEQTFLEDTQGVLVDMGCGMGRVFSIAAHYHFTKIIGVDFSKRLCDIAQVQAQNTMSRHPETVVNVVCEDAATFVFPTDTSTVFLFNPFDQITMMKVLRNLEKSVAQNPRPIKVLYANPVCKKLFLEAGFVETFHTKKLIYLEGSVLETN